MSGNVGPYLALITSEHQKPNFLAVMTALLQGQADNQSLLNNLYSYFDKDSAIGAQLDAVGLWVGISRQVEEPLEGVYFSLDTFGVGLDQGTWYGPFDPVEGLVSLDDSTYRLLINIKIEANKWQGTTATMAAILNQFFQPFGVTIVVQDNQNMSMTVGAVGFFANAVISAIFSNGIIPLKPEGVGASFVAPSIGGTPFFGLDSEIPTVSGFDVGSWAIDPADADYGAFIIGPGPNESLLG